MDLGAMLYALTRAVLDAEVPVLRAHGVEMWDYAVMSGLERGAAPTQSQLAASVRRDKTRLIPILDRLEARGLLRRDADPADRRNRVVTLTDAGRELLGQCRASIQDMEEELLVGLAVEERTALRATLAKLMTELDL